MRIRRGEVEYEPTVEKIEILFSEISQMRESSKLEKEGNADILSSWLLPLRMRELNTVQMDPFSECSEVEGGKTALKDRAENILRENGMNGEILFVGKCGSTLYGLNSSGKIIVISISYT